MKFKHYNGAIYNMMKENNVYKVWGNNKEEYVTYELLEVERFLKHGIWELIAG